MNNKNIKILITGGSGQLAKSVSEVFPKDDLVLLSKKDLDIINKRKVLREVIRQNPDFVFHFASMTRGDECAKNPKLAFKINVEGTRNIVEACKKYKKTLLFVSTNEVFDGNNKFPYKETDKPNPKTVIGDTKLEAEKIIRKSLTKYFIIRSSWLYSKWSQNFLHIVLDKARKEGKLELVIDEISSPTYSLDLAKALKKIITTKKYGTYHISNSGSASRLEFAKEAFRIYNLKKIKITPVNLEKYKRLSKPPLYSALNNIKAKKIGILMPKWENALKRFLLSSRI